MSEPTKMLTRRLFARFLGAGAAAAPLIGERGRHRYLRMGGSLGSAPEIDPKWELFSKQTSTEDRKREDGVLARSLAMGFDPDIFAIRSYSDSYRVMKQVRLHRAELNEWRSFTNRIKRAIGLPEAWY